MGGYWPSGQEGALMPKVSWRARVRGPILAVALALTLVSGLLGTATKAVTAGSDSPAVQAVQSVLDGGAQTAAAAPRKSTSSEAKPYRKVSVGNWYVGSWKTSQGVGYCVEFSQLRSKYKVGSKRTDSDLDNLSASETQRALWITEKYAKSSNKNAAAGALAIWKMTDDKNKTFKRWYKANKSKLKKLGIDQLSNKILAASKNAGKNGVSVTSTQGLPGQVVTITVKGKIDNKAAAGKVASLSLSNFTVGSAKVKLNSAGVGVYRATVKSMGRASGVASLAVPSKYGWVSKDTYRQQVIFTRKPTTVKAGFWFEKKLGDVKVVAKCDTNCKGEAQVTLSRVVPCGSKPVTTYVYDNGRVVGSFNTAGCKTGTVTLEKPVLDTHVITTRYCYTGTKTCGADKTKYVVNCPPWISAKGESSSVSTATWACEECSETTKTSSTKITLTAPKTTRAYIAHVNLAGKNKDVKLAGGQTVVVDGGTTALTDVKISFTAYANGSFKVVIAKHDLGKNKAPVKD